MILLFSSDLPEGSSHARKAARRLKREQRERERQRMERHQHEFRLERKRPQSEHLNPTSDSHLPPTSVLGSHSPYSTNPRLTGSSTNPQFAKWILEQNVHYQTDRGSEIDLRSSRSSLTNISERDRPGSPSNGYSSSHYQREVVSERGGGGYYRPTSPPVRDSAPSSRPADYPYPSRYNGYGSSSALDVQAMSESPTKFSEYTIPEMDEPVFHPRPVLGAPPITSNAPGHKNTFSSLSSQMTVESQQMLTPFSQQQTPSQQQQQQHLDKLSMDVMLHTQLSGASIQGGITSLIPKFNQAKNVKTCDGKPHLDRADLKELDMDEIDLEKQRIRLMFYEQQRQEKEKKETSCHRNSGSVEVLEGTTDKEDHCLSTEQLRQELESLDQIVSDQKKKYREIKMAREREEQNLKQAEKELYMERVNPNDQHQWHVEQKRRLREIEKLKSEQNERLQQIQYNEHRAKNKLKAIEAQATLIRQQLQKAEAAAMAAAKSVPQDVSSRSPSQAKSGFKGGYDVFPSKLPSNDRPRAEERCVDQSATSNTIEWDIDGSKCVPAHAISFESMSTAIMFDQPEIARELATTISESILTEPTQDDPAPTKWPPNGFGSRGLLPNEDFFSTKSHSRNTLITESDDIFLNQDKRMRREHPQSMVTMDTIDSSLPSLGSMDDREFTHIQQTSRGYPQVGDKVPSLRRTTRMPSNTAQQNQLVHSHDPWNSVNSKQLPGGGEREVGRGEQVPSHYDVPAQVRAAYQLHPPTSNRQHGRYQRNRGTSSSRNQTPSSTMATSDLPSLDRPVQDAPRLVNGNSTGAPDVVPVSYSPVSPHLHSSPVPGMQQRQVTGSESVMGSSVPPPRSPSFPIYDVPPPSNEKERFLGVNYNPTSSSPVPTSHQHDPALQHQKNISSHMTGHVTTSGGMPPSSPAADNIYDQPRSSISRSSHSFRSTGTSGALYDVPASARRSAVYEGGVASLKQDSQSPSHLPNHVSADHSIPLRVGGGEKSVPNATPVFSKSKPTSSHRYGISKPGMGHSYSRGRPDHMQQIDKAKQYMDSRSYRNQGGVRHPERIQRQQTDL